MTREQSEFDAFVVSTASELLRFAYLLTGDRALSQDLVQQALMKAHRAWKGAVRADKPSAYVRRVIINEHTSWRRRRRNTEVVQADLPDRVLPDGLDDLVARDAMWRALDRLPRRQRAVLVLRYYEDRADGEIAGLLGCAEGTVRSLASRAFETLRAHPGLTEGALMERGLERRSREARG